MNAGYRLLAAKYLRKQAKILRAQFDGIRAAEDIEYVHRARVASRRLRAALQMFGECFKPRLVKRWSKEIKRITGGLGDARDCDVQILFLREELSKQTDPLCKPGIERLLILLEYQREDLQKGVLKSLNRMQERGFFKDLEKGAKQVQAAAGIDAAERNRGSYARAEEHILTNLDDVLSQGKALDREEDAVGHHALRIAVKRLRYTIEIAKPLYGRRIDASVNLVKRIQTLLGEIHDCDVWIDELEEFAIEECDRLCALYGHANLFARLSVGIERIAQDRRETRVRAFGELVRLWRETTEQGGWNDLVAVVRSSSPETNVDVPSESAAASAETTIPEEVSAESVAEESAGDTVAVETSVVASSAVKDADADSGEAEFPPPAVRAEFEKEGDRSLRSDSGASAVPKKHPHKLIVSR